jgi:hypothetical protein
MFYSFLLHDGRIQFYLFLSLAEQFLALHARITTQPTTRRPLPWNLHMRSKGKSINVATLDARALLFAGSSFTVI